MKKIILIIIAISLLFTSISCEKFPKEKDLIGTWIEQTDNVFKQKYIFEEEIVYSLYSTSIDTFFYRLDKKQEYLYLISKQDPEATSSHEINLNKKKKELTIWGLYMSIPEEGPSKTVFKKE